MIHSPIIRMLLAFHLAICSPAICCCAIKSVIGRISGVGPTVCEAPKCCGKYTVIDREIAMNDEGDCCGEDSAAAQSLPTRDSGCQCHERTDDEIRLDTGGKITLPIVCVLWLPAMQGYENSPSIMHSRTVANSDGPLRAHPPPTLLAQHCLLLI